MKNIIIFLTIGLINCAFCQDKNRSSELVQWHESLDLAYPEEIDFKLQLQKTTLLQGDPLLIRCLIVNKTAKVITVVPPGDRLRGFMLGTLDFKVLTNKGVEYPYQIGFHARGVLLPGDEKVIRPRDSLYINAILWPNNFYDWGKRRERAQRKIFPAGEYKLCCRINLGVKFYPKPSRDLIIESDTIMFTINAVDADKQNLLMAVDPLISAFFYKLEEILLLGDSLRQARLTLIPLFDEIKRHKSFMMPLIDFVSIRIRASTNTSNIDSVIADIGDFVTAHQGSILAEEMEFLLVKILYENNKTNTLFAQKAHKVIAKYPKNINIFAVRNWLEEK